MHIKITATGLKEAQKRLSKPLGRVMQDGFLRMAQVVFDAVKAEAPRKTGKLAAGLSLRVSRNHFSISTGAVKYEQYPRLGTVGHSIYPRKKKALFWPGLPHPVAWAAHPGIRRPNDYPTRGVAQAQGEISRLIPVIGGEIVQEIEK